MDVGSQNAYPSCSLSNFAAHEFVIFCHRLNWLRDMLPAVEDESIKTVKELW